MKRVLLIVLTIFFSLAIGAQDFTTRFMAKYKQDENLKCITISPTMMKKILKTDAAEKDENISEMISDLKSMRLFSSNVRATSYYRKALKIADVNSNRFEPYLFSKNKQGECKILVRKNKGTIVEMVMLTNEEHKFSVINLTGIMSDEFISKLARNMRQKHP